MTDGFTPWLDLLNNVLSVVIQTSGVMNVFCICFSYWHYCFQMLFMTVTTNRIYLKKFIFILLFNTFLQKVFTATFDFNASLLNKVFVLCWSTHGLWSMSEIFNLFKSTAPHCPRPYLKTHQSRSDNILK